MTYLFNLIQTTRINEYYFLYIQVIAILSFPGILQACVGALKVTQHYSSCSVNKRITKPLITIVHLMAFIHSATARDMETQNVRNHHHTSIVARIKQKWSLNFKPVQMYKDPKAQVNFK